MGQNLQASTTLRLDAAAPAEGLLIHVASNDPGRLLLSTAPDCAGAAAIRVPVRAGLRRSAEFYVYGLGSSGTASYTASAPGFEAGTGTVALAPSGIVFARAAIGLPFLRTTIRAGKSQLKLQSALLDSSMNYLAEQPVAGGIPAYVKVTTSNPQVGAFDISQLTIPAGLSSATAQFEPLALGNTSVALSVPQGFNNPVKLSTIPVTVFTPGIAITDGLTMGRNLEIDGVLSLGEPAPAGGVSVTLTSGDPTRLLLSSKPTTPGSSSIQIAIPPGGVSSTYALQALGDSGKVTHTATAPGYVSRIGTITLTPSGVVLGGPQGPPDEAELFRKEVAEGPHGFLSSASSHATVPISVYMVQLDPTTHRGADITVQRLRAGLALTVNLRNNNAAAGSLADSLLTIKAGESTAVTRFTPISAGTIQISVVTPAGFTPASNSTSLSVKVTP